MSDKWIVPIVVAVITGLFSLINIFVQVYIQNSSQQAIVRSLKEEESLGTISGVERGAFYQKALELIEQIDTNFEAICSFTSRKKAGINDKSAGIDDSLEQYRILLETAPVSISDKTKEKLKEYSDFIANSLVEIQEKNPSSDKKKENLNKSKELREAAIKLLKENRLQKSSP